METQNKREMTPEEQQEAAEAQFAQPERSNAEGAMEHFNMMPPEDELEWLRGQYVVLKQQNDSLRQAYSTAGQEASTLRRAMTSRQLTLLEHAAVAAFPETLNRCLQLTPDNFAIAAAQAVVAADALFCALRSEVKNG